MSTKKLQILGSLGNKVYTQNDEPVDAADGSLWVDLDESDIDDVDIVIAPKTAEVGQMIIVKSVDESGRPIMWEAVDNIKYIASSVEPSNKNTMWIDTSDNSVDFEQVEIDATFTKSGFAADAQLTGAAISSLEYRLESKLDELTKIHVGSVEPTEKISGMVWIDTSEPSQTTSEV